MLLQSLDQVHELLPPLQSATFPSSVRFRPEARQDIPSRWIFWLADARTLQSSHYPPTKRNGPRLLSPNRVEVHASPFLISAYSQAMRLVDRTSKSPASDAGCRAWGDVLTLHEALS